MTQPALVERGSPSFTSLATPEASEGYKSNFSSLIDRIADLWARFTAWLVERLEIIAAWWTGAPPQQPQGDDNLIRRPLNPLHHGEHPSPFSLPPRMSFLEDAPFAPQEVGVNAPIIPEIPPPSSRTHSGELSLHLNRQLLSPFRHRALNQENTFFSVPAAILHISPLLRLPMRYIQPVFARFASSPPLMPRNVFMIRRSPLAIEGAPALAPPSLVTSRCAWPPVVDWRHSQSYPDLIRGLPCLRTPLSSSFKPALVVAAPTDCVIKQEPLQASVIDEEIEALLQQHQPACHYLEMLPEELRREVFCYFDESSSWQLKSGSLPWASFFAIHAQRYPHQHSLPFSYIFLLDLGANPLKKLNEFIAPKDQQAVIDASQQLGLAIALHNELTTHHIQKNQLHELLLLLPYVGALQFISDTQGVLMRIT